MTRTEQIKNAAQNYEINTNSDSLSFITGAIWADINPHWHKYPDEKPIEDGVYLICIKNNVISESFFMIPDNDKEGYFSLVDKSVIAWMELPQPPKFD